MYTALTATSLTLAGYLRRILESDPRLGDSFNSDNGGSMVVSLNTPQEMTETEIEGLSLWLYKIDRDNQLLNAPRERVDVNRLDHVPLPLRLHYLLTPIITGQSQVVTQTKQEILGKVLQALHDHPRLRGVDLQGDFSGTTVELNIRLEPLSLEEITRVYEALARSYQLSVSYEVSIVFICSDREPDEISPVEVALPEYGVIVSSRETG